MTALQPVVPGSEVTARYIGLVPGEVLEVKILFR
jgi:hypothetical protein